MKNKLPKLVLRLCLLVIFFANPSFAQQSVDAPQGRYTQPHAGFDVIILKNGDLIYGLVKEVGIQFIKYQRTDIPDGPEYVLVRSDVYAISYRNQVKDILLPGESHFTPVIKDAIAGVSAALNDSLLVKKNDKWSFFRQSNVLFGIGFIRGFSKVDHANDYSPGGLQARGATRPRSRPVRSPHAHSPAIKTGDVGNSPGHWRPGHGNRRGR